MCNNHWRNIIFICSLLVYGGLFAYEKVLNSDIDKLNQSLELIKKVMIVEYYDGHVPGN